MQVICVKWGERYGAEWVLRLRDMVSRHLPCTHEFICVTDRPVEAIACRELPSSLPGWWAKVGLFKPGYLTGETLYLDLDVVARGDLSVFRKGAGESVWALDDFSYSLRTPKPFLDDFAKGLLGGVGTANSSVMYWHDDAGARVWETFSPAVMDRLHGDQNHITQALWPAGRLSLYEPGLACSYKYHVMNGRQFGSLVVFHGSPKPNELGQRDPLKRAWLGEAA